jgi:hypothetical protein
MSKKYGVSGTVSGPAVVAQRDQLAVQHDPLARECPQRGDHLGGAGGDVVQRPGVHGHAVAIAVRLDPDAIQLPLDRRRYAGLGQRLLHCGRGLRQHRLHALADLQPELLQARLAVDQRRHRDRCRGTAQHGRGADLGQADPGRGGDRVGHHAVQGALAQLAADEEPQEPLLGRSRPAEQFVHHRAPLGLRAGAGDLRHLGERRVHLGHVEARLAGRVRDLHQRPPAHPGTPLAQLTRQVHHDDLGLVRRRGPAQQSGDQVGLGTPGPGGGHGGRGVDEIGEQHGPSLSHRADIAGRGGVRSTTTASVRPCRLASFGR